MIISYSVGINSRFAKINKKAQEQKWLKNWTILKNLKEKKIKFQPYSQLRDLLMSGQMPYTISAVCLVANNYTKLWKTSENLLVSQGLSYTVLCISVGLRPHGLETRVIIKISTHPCYPRTFACFFKQKKSKIADSKKLPFSKPSILNIFSQNWVGLVLGSGG